MSQPLGGGFFAAGAAVNGLSVSDIEDSDTVTWSDEGAGVVKAHTTGAEIVNFDGSPADDQKIRRVIFIGGGVSSIVLTGAAALDPVAIYLAVATYNGAVAGLNQINVTVDPVTSTVSIIADVGPNVAVAIF